MVFKPSARDFIITENSVSAVSFVVIPHPSQGVQRLWMSTGVDARWLDIAEDRHGDPLRQAQPETEYTEGASACGRLFRRGWRRRRIEHRVRQSGESPGLEI